MHSSRAALGIVIRRRISPPMCSIVRSRICLVSNGAGHHFASWLFRIAANAIADRGKRAAQFEAIKLREIPQNDPSDEADLAEAEHRARSFKLVEKLPADQRRVITMRFAHQKSITEIAKDIGRSEGAIKQLQFRGLQSLRTMVGER